MTSIEVIIDFRWSQQLLPRRLTVDALVDATTAALTRVSCGPSRSRPAD